MAGGTSASFTARTVNPKNIFTELKRRNVYKVAIAYAVVAWLLMQVAIQTHFRARAGNRSQVIAINLSVFLHG
jgi:hypothetical protein